MCKTSKGITSCTTCHGHKQCCVHLGGSGDGKPIEQAGPSGTGLGGKHESLKVQHESNELWQANLRLKRCVLKVEERQVAQGKHLIGMVEGLTTALGKVCFGSSASHRVGGSRSVVKGKGKVVEEEEGDEGSNESDEEDADDAKGEAEVGGD